MYRFGLVLLGLLALGDIATPLVTDGEHPPMSIAIGAAVVGLISVVLVVFAWRGRRWALAPLITLRLASALLAVPAFFESGVPTAVVVTVGVAVAATVVGVIAVLLPQRELAGAR